MVDQDPLVISSWPSVLFLRRVPTSTLVGGGDTLYLIKCFSQSLPWIAGIPGNPLIVCHFSTAAISFLSDIFTRSFLFNSRRSPFLLFKGLLLITKTRIDFPSEMLKIQGFFIFGPKMVKIGNFQKLLKNISESQTFFIFDVFYGKSSTGCRISLSFSLRVLNNCLKIRNESIF